MIKPLLILSKVLLFIALFCTSHYSRSQCPPFNATATPAIQTVCSGSPISNIVLSSSQPGTVFNWTRDNINTVTGIPAGGTGNINGTLTNTTNAPVAVTFTTIPTQNLTLVINETFNTILPPGWAQQNLSSPIGSSPTWYTGASFPPYSAPGFIEVNKNSGVPPGIISNWLFTPEIQMKNGDRYYFYTRASSILDNMQIRISANGPSLNVGNTSTSVGDFQYFQFEIGPVTGLPYPTYWSFVSAQVVNLPAGTVSGRLAFRYYSPNPNFLNTIGIDNFTYFSTTAATSCIGQPITATVVVNPNATVNLVPNQTLCSGAPTLPVNFSSLTTGGTTVFNWTNSNTSIGLGANGIGNIPSFTATNTSNAPITATITVTPSFTNTNLFSFINPNTITIPVNGVASPYPSTVMVSGLPSTGVKLLAVKLHDMNHTASGDLDIALRSPTGQTVMLMSDVGGSNTLSNTTITIDDTSAFSIPNTVNPIPSGTYRCTNLMGAIEPDNFPVPGPGAFFQPNPSLSLFSITMNCNGQWALWVIDQISGNAGSINGGYELIFGYPATCTGTPSTFTYIVNPLPTVSIISDIPPPIQPGQVMTLTAIVAPPGGTFVWFKDGVLIPGATSNTLGGITVNDLGNYTVTYTDPNGCVNTSAAFSVYARPTNGLFIHPNPNNGHFRVTFYNVANEEVTVTVYNSAGKVVTQRKSMTGTSTYAKVEMELPLPYTVGTYLVEVRNAKNKQIGAQQVSIAR